MFLLFMKDYPEMDEFSNYKRDIYEDESLEEETD